MEKINTNDYQKLRDNQSQERNEKVLADDKTENNEGKTKERSIKESDKEPYEKLEKKMQPNDYQKLQERKSNEFKEDIKIYPTGDKIETSTKRSEKVNRNDEDENGYLKLT